MIKYEKSRSVHPWTQGPPTKTVINTILQQPCHTCKEITFPLGFYLVKMPRVRTRQKCPTLSRGGGGQFEKILPLYAKYEVVLHVSLVILRLDAWAKYRAKLFVCRVICDEKILRIFLEFWRNFYIEMYCKGVL